ncbi:hypothetical protein KO481_03310 [Nocardia sp. NEAU-G5]|uniref:Uncharacterized protein n=1 Tax=Nocardia albiluteola TaxID=2842303 RepID=A0ABS6ARM8_9NOCA|nr:hypothetical protein [Nocardia albiluteola]MBU3060548.1 hypothetical protein [Nocardia albiluteola]
MRRLFIVGAMAAATALGASVITGHMATASADDAPLCITYTDDTRCSPAGNQVMIYPQPEPVVEISTGTHQGWIETKYGRRNFGANEMIDGGHLIVTRIYCSS